MQAAVSEKLRIGRTVSLSEMYTLRPVELSKAIKSQQGYILRVQIDEGSDHSVNYSLVSSNRWPIAGQV